MDSKKLLKPYKVISLGFKIEQNWDSFKLLTHLLGHLWLEVCKKENIQESNLIDYENRIQNIYTNSFSLSLLPGENAFQLRVYEELAEDLLFKADESFRKLSKKQKLEINLNEIKLNRLLASEKDYNQRLEAQNFNEDQLLHDEIWKEYPEFDRYPHHEDYEFDFGAWQILKVQTVSNSLGLTVFSLEIQCLSEYSLKKFDNFLKIGNSIRFIKFLKENLAKDLEIFKFELK